jgi:diguanylate cyclase (GGDEF)-like protein
MKEYSITIPLFNILQASNKRLSIIHLGQVTMTTNKHPVMYQYIIIALSFVVYALCVYVYTSITLTYKRNEAIIDIDEKLKTGASAVYNIMGTDFFRRATHKGSIDPEEDWENIRRLTSFNKQAGLAFLYSTIKKNGKIYVLSSSATDEEINNNTELHYFHHYDTANDELVSTFKDHTIRKVEYRDKWGEFRGLFIPIRIDNTHTVVVAAEVEMSFLKNMISKIESESYLNGLLFLIFITPFVFSVRYILKEENLQLQELLYTDNLTKLPNRHFLFKYLDNYFSKANKQKQNLALLHIDIDDFKEINDGFGYRVGDDALKSIANRISSYLDSRCILTRYEGDEFFAIILYEKITNILPLSAQALLNLFTKPIEADEYTFYLSCSIGISLTPLHAQNTNELIQNAHMATSKAKAEGKNGYQLFNSEINKIYNKKCELRQNINSAINNDEYYLVYQPQYNAVTNRVIGVEALLRWQHPTKGIIPPAEFIPYAEGSGLIIEIGKIVLEKAISKGAEWKKADIISDIRIAINISPPLLNQDDFLQTVNNLLAKYKCSPNILKFEITEQVVIDNQSIAISKLNEIRNLGVEISIDDFGSGYSSLGYLKDLPVDQLKIDRSFIVNIVKEQKNRAIIKSIVQLCRGLSLDVIAEGAETKEEVDFLVRLGCECIQGFYFSKPLNDDKFYHLLGEMAVP